MDDEFAKLTDEQLRELLASETSKTEKLKSDIVELENAVQETGRSNERQEERMMNFFNKRIRQLKAENSAIAARIQREEEYVRTTLSEKYHQVLRDKAELETALAFQESQVIDQLQMELDRLTQESIKLESQLKSHEIDNIPIETDKIDASLGKMLQDSEKTKQDYDRELSNLRQEIERLITANSILLQRVSAAQMELMNASGPNDTNGFPQLYPEETEHPKNRRHSDITPASTRKRRRRQSIK